MTHHELSPQSLSNYKTIFNLFNDGAIALASSQNRTSGLTIAWGSLGILWNKKICTIFIHESRYSKMIFDGADTISICFFADEYKDSLRYFGQVFGISSL